MILNRKQFPYLATADFNVLQAKVDEDNRKKAERVRQHLRENYLSENGSIVLENTKKIINICLDKIGVN